MRRENFALVEELVDILQKTSKVKEEVKEIQREKEDLGNRISKQHIRIKELEVNLEETLKKAEIKRREEIEKIEQLKQELERVREDKESLEKRLALLHQRESAITNDALQIKEKKTKLEEDVILKMYQWIKVRQNPRTGLVLSFEGDV